MVKVELCMMYNLNTSKRPNHNRSVAGTGTQETTTAVCTPDGKRTKQIGHDVVCNSRGVYSRGASDSTKGAMSTQLKPTGRARSTGRNDRVETDCILTRCKSNYNSEKSVTDWRV